MLAQATHPDRLSQADVTGRQFQSLVFDMRFLGRAWAV
jgi:hypothetical protein